MSLYKPRNRKNYSYSFNLSGRRFSGSTGTGNEREAKRYLAARRKEAKAQVEAERKFLADGPMSLEIAASRYWHERGIHLANREDCFRYLGWLIGHFGKHITLDKITDSMVAAMVVKRRADGVANATVNRSATVPLRGLMLRAKRVWKVPVAEIDWKQHLLKEAQERVREATVDDEQKLMASMRDDYAPAVRFAFLTGCRRMEIVGLTWSKVDMQGEMITITGKGDMTRVIPMTRAIRKLLEVQLGNHPTAVFTYQVRSTRKDRRLVRGERRPITKEGFKTAWRRYKDASVEDFRFHDTRHTAATRTLRNGNLKIVQRMLGHTNIATTARYAHAQIDDIRAAMEAASDIQTRIPSTGEASTAMNLQRKSA